MLLFSLMDFSVGLSWGWGVMIIGAGILLYATFKLYNGED